MKYLVHFTIYSQYENIDENIESESVLEFEATSKDEILHIIEDFEQDMDWDDSEIINYEAKSDLICTTREFIKLTDEKGNEIEL